MVMLMGGGAQDFSMSLVSFKVFLLCVGLWLLPVCVCVLAFCSLSLRWVCCISCIGRIWEFSGALVLNGLVNICVWFN